jgi:hypothetical protein
LQNLTPANFVWAEMMVKMHLEDVAKNDGLSFDDFCEWLNSDKQSDGRNSLFKFRY